MYDLKDHGLVDLNEEAKVIAAFISDRWNSAIPWSSFVTSVLACAERDFRFVFEENPVHAALVRLLSLRRTEALSKLFASDNAAATAANSCDRLALMLVSAYLNITHYREAALSQRGRWDFSKRASECFSEVSCQFPAIFWASPKGYDAYQKKWIEASQSPVINTQDGEGFAGADTSGAGTLGFATRMQLASLFYDDTEQGQRPYRVLVSALYSHGLRLVEHNNTVQCLNDLKQLEPITRTQGLYIRLEDAMQGIAFTSPLAFAFTLGDLLSAPPVEKFEVALDRVRRQSEANAELSSAEREQSRKALAQRLVGEIRAEERCGVQALRDKQARENARSFMEQAEETITAREIPFVAAAPRPWNRMR